MPKKIDELIEILPKLAFDGEKGGGALVIQKDGERLCAEGFGLARPDTPWSANTLSVNFSVGKGVLATLVAILVSKKRLDYAAPICRYWPDFAQNGKQSLRLLDVLRHRANLYRIDSVIQDNEEAKDWEAMLAKVARMPTTAPQGEYASAYSALVSGWVLGGVVEKATDMPLQSALDTYLAKPLGVQGQMFFGLPVDLRDKVALPTRLWEGKSNRKPTLKPDSQNAKDFFESLDLWSDLAGKKSTAAINRLYFDPRFLNMQNYKNALLADGKTPIDYYDPAFLSAPIPAANGVASANALAAMYAMHANDGVFGDQRLIDAATLAHMRATQSDGLDAVMPANMGWRAGFHRVFSVGNYPDAYGHMGYNGSLAFCDPERRLAVAFIHNFDTTMLNDARQFVVGEMALRL